MIHTVLPGETLRGIAAMHGTGSDLLAAWNGTAEPLTGQELLVLHPQALHTVRCGESWQSLSARFGLPELRRCNPGPLRPGRRLVLGFRERGTRPLALCGTMGPEWNDLGLSYICELAADAAELDGDGALHRLPLRGRRHACASREAEQSWKPCSAAGPRRSAFCSRRLHSAARMARRRSSWRSVICCRTAIRLRWSPGCRRFWRSGAED